MYRRRMDDALLLALVNHGLIYGLDPEQAWALGERLLAEGGYVRQMADRMRDAGTDEWLTSISPPRTR